MSFSEQLLSIISYRLLEIIESSILSSKKDMFSVGTVA